MTDPADDMISGNRSICLAAIVGAGDIAPLSLSTIHAQHAVRGELPAVVAKYQYVSWPAASACDRHRISVAEYRGHAITGNHKRNALVTGEAAQCLVDPLMGRCLVSGLGDLHGGYSSACARWVPVEAVA